MLSKAKIKCVKSSQFHKKYLNQEGARCHQIQAPIYVDDRVNHNCQIIW